MGHFTSLVIWEGFQGEAVAELNPTAVRAALVSSGKGFSEQPDTPEHFTHFWQPLWGHKGERWGEAVKSLLSSASLQRQSCEVSCDSPKSIF